MFTKGRQKDFINCVCRRLDVSPRKLCLLYGTRLGVGYSAIKRYRREEILLSLSLVEELCQITGLPFQRLEVTGLLPDNWGAVKGGKKGIRALFVKRSENLREWRAKGGRVARARHPSKEDKKIVLPMLNNKLSEFIGIHLGDGTLTEHFVKITQDYRYDMPYVFYIAGLTMELFGKQPTIRREKGSNLVYVQLFSKKVCEYLHSKWAMPYGDKIKGIAMVPNEIMKNKQFTICCLRGLIDTDGSVSKDGNSISIRFSSHNKTLVDQVEDIGKSLGIFTFRNPLETGTRSWDNVVKYFRVVGSSNPRHIIRFHRRYSENELLKKSEILKHYKTYKGISLPFRLDGPVV